MRHSDSAAVLPAEPAAIADALPANAVAILSEHSHAASRHSPMASLALLFGWLWRWLVGAVLCLNYLTSVAVFGWFFRWTQGCVLYGWWKDCRKPVKPDFQDLCRQLDGGEPTLRPRWLLHQDTGPYLSKSDRSGRATRESLLRRPFRALGHSLWLNIRYGFVGLFCTYLLLGIPCLLMFAGWEFGWLNSFHKGYEIAPAGVVMSWAGIFLFVAAMFYVPMAQVHQAVTGDARAFFDFRFVWRLIQVKTFASAGLAGLMCSFAVLFEGLKTAPAFFDGFSPTWTDASDAEVLGLLRRYLLGCCLALFPALLLTHLLAARIYRRAVLTIVERGLIAYHELHPVVRTALVKLELIGALPAESPGLRGAAGGIAWWVLGAADFLVLAVATVLLAVQGPLAWLAILGIWLACWAVMGVFFLFRTGGLKWYLAVNARRLAFGLTAWIWFVFIAKTYVGEFLNYHPVVGFMNHSLVQFPCFDFVPAHLVDSASRQIQE